MKKTLLLVFVTWMVFPALFAQDGKDVPIKRISGGQSNRVSFVAMLPLAAFERSHFVGFGAGYSWSKHRFGPSGKIGKAALIFQGGGEYYLGKKVKTAGVSFRYGGYLDIHAMAGMQYNGWERLHFSLTAGPVLSVYRGNADLGLGAQGGVDYYINDKISVGPRIIYRGHQDVSALYAIGVQAAYVF